MALPAFDRFASNTVDELLAVVKAGDDGEELAKALMSLHRMLRTDRLPSARFGSVVETARACLVNTTSPAVWHAAVELAVGTGDAELRLIVAGIASGLVEPAFRDRPDLHLWARAVARRLLRRALQTRGVPTPDADPDLHPDQPDDCGNDGCPKLAG